MVKRLLGVVFVVASLVGIVGATPASARSDATVTVTCTGGQVVVSDANAVTGQTTANAMYNVVNPFGEVCTVHG